MKNAALYRTRIDKCTKFDECVLFLHLTQIKIKFAMQTSQSSYKRFIYKLLLFNTSMKSYEFFVLFFVISSASFGSTVYIFTNIMGINSLDF